MRHFILFLLIWGSFQSHAQQVVPEYPGGETALFKYLSDSLLLPPVLYKKGLKGETVVSFMVDTGGYVTDVHITRSLHPALDTAVIRLISGMSRWSPGMADGHPVKVRFTLPIKVTVPRVSNKPSSYQPFKRFYFHMLFGKGMYSGTKPLPMTAPNTAFLGFSVGIKKINIGISTSAGFAKFTQSTVIRNKSFEKGHQLSLSHILLEFNRRISITPKVVCSPLIGVGIAVQHIFNTDNQDLSLSVRVPGIQFGTMLDWYPFRERNMREGSKVTHALTFKICISPVLSSSAIITNPLISAGIGYGLKTRKYL